MPTFEIDTDSSNDSGLSAKFELRINGSRVLKIHAHPQTHPDSIADMLQDAVFLFRDGLSLMTAGTDLDAIGEPLPMEWIYFNYDPAIFEAEQEAPPDTELLAFSDVTEFKHVNTSVNSQEQPPRIDFYGEQPLVGEKIYTINGVTAVKINHHPVMGINELADILEDAALDLRKELENRNPHRYDPDTISLTVPAMIVGSNLTNLMESYDTKFIMALEMEDHETADKYFEKGEKLYGWMTRNYTPEAIKNSPATQQRSHRIERFKGIRKHSENSPTSEQEP
jgi:hypothetical protein